MTEVRTHVSLVGPSGPCSFEIRHGDLFSWQERLDVLFVSVTQGDFDRMEELHRSPAYQEWNRKFLIGQLMDHGVNPFVARDLSRLRLEEGMDLWISEPLQLPDRNTFRPQRMVCVHRVGRTVTGARRTFDDAFASLAILEAHGVDLGTVVLPLLGAGGLGVPMSVLGAVLVDSARAAARRLPSLQRLVVIERDERRVEELCEAVDEHLGFSQSVVHSEVFKLIRDDLYAQLQWATEQRGGDPRVFLELARSLASDLPAPTVIAASGRILVERVVREFDGQGRDLAWKVESLRDRGVPRWVIGYLHVLRTMGNAMVHDPGTEAHSVAPDDLAAVAVCMLRVLSFWQSSVINQD